MQGLGAKWPSRFSDERFSDRAEGEVRAEAALTHGISALFTTGHRIPVKVPQTYLLKHRDLRPLKVHGR
jgi:hypothetical protein